MNMMTEKILETRNDGEHKHRNHISNRTHNKHSHQKDSNKAHNKVISNKDNHQKDRGRKRIRFADEHNHHHHHHHHHHRTKKIEERTMKVNVRYEKQRFIVGIQSTDTIYQVKQKIQRAVDVVQPVNSIMTDTVPCSTLYFAGTSLHDDMVVNDIGIVSGSTLLYKYTEMQRSVLKVYVKFLKKTIELSKECDISSMTVGDVRVYLQNQIGIPVSMFYIVQTVNSTRELFDIHDLTYYNITEGDTLVLHIWKGTRRVVMNAMNSDISGTMSNLPNFYENPSLNRYLLRVVLFIAAHFDHMKLAAQVLLQGIRCEEPVGEHSSRQWCCTKSHPEVFKTPIHQAAQQGSFECLKMFIRHSPSSLICRDGNHLTPGNYAAMNRNIDCWKLIVASQFIHSRICGFSLQSHLRIMRWCTAAKERVSYFKGDAKKSILLHSTLGRYNNTYLGNSLYIDGFNHKTFYDRSMYRSSKSPDILAVATRQNTKSKFREGDYKLMEKEPTDTAVNNMTEQNDTDNEQLSKNSSSTKLLKRDLKKKASVTIKKDVQKDTSTAGTAVTAGLTEPHSTKSKRRKKKPKKINKTKKINMVKSNINLTDITRTMRMDEEIIVNNIIRNDDDQRKTWRPRSTNLLFGSETTSVIGPERSGFTPLFMRFNRDLPSQTNSLILGATGMQPRDLACASLQLGEKFGRKSWMRQFAIAVNSSTNRIKRGRILEGSPIV